MQALSLLNEGKLDAAIESALDHVRKTPADTGGREILAELFCLRGEYERADKQCEAVVVQQPQAALAVSLLRQLLRAQTSRRECWYEGRLPEFIGEPPESCQKALSALLAFRSGDGSQAIELLEQAEASRTATPGVCNGKAFNDIRDLDDFCAGFWEVLTSTGKYYWIPTARIISAQFSKVARPRDLLWCQCEMVVEDGPTGVVYIPTLYIDTDQTTDAAERLARATSWIEEENQPVRGLGQRSLLIGDDELGLLELESLEFDRPEE